MRLKYGDYGRVMEAGRGRGSLISPESATFQAGTWWNTNKFPFCYNLILLESATLQDGTTMEQQKLS